MGYEKVSTKKAPGFMLKLLSFFNSEIKALSTFLGKKLSADNSDTKKTFNWSPIPLEKSLQDATSSVKAVLDKRS